MTLQEMIQQLDELSPEERNELRRAIDQRDGVRHPNDGLTPQERVLSIRAAARAIREGFTDEEWAEIEQAMNAEYIEPFDEDEWKD
ncbi:MAG: hypothetical protein IAE80_12390 [Anaerolinea sp.]|nr:hypothetical protein [Anaerolinea sp.]